MKIWKMVNGTWRGYGNGLKAVIYVNTLDDSAHVRIYKGDTFITSSNDRPNIPSAKRWAEKNYLKGTK